MHKAYRVTITAPLAVRVAFLLRDYSHIIEKNDNLMQLLSGLRKRYSKDVFANWQNNITNGNWEEFVTSILETHYDPSYARSTASRPLTDILTLTAIRLDEDDIIRLASELMAQDS